MGGVVVHPNHPSSSPHQLKLGAYFFLLMENHLVPPRSDLILKVWNNAIIKKKLDRAGERPPLRHYIKKRPSWPRPRNPPNPGSWSWVWCHVPGTVTQRAGPKLTTQPTGSGATFLGPLPTGPGPGWQHSPSHQEHSEGSFFPQAGKSAPVGVRTPHLRVPLAAPRPTDLTTFGTRAYFTWSCIQYS